MLMKSDNHIFLGAFCSGHPVVLQFLQHMKLRKKDGFLQLTEREGEGQPWSVAVGRGVLRTSHSQDKLVFCLNESGLEAGSFSPKTDVGKGPKKIRDLTSLHQMQIRLPQNRISSVDLLCDKLVSNPGLKSSSNSNAITSSGKCTGP